MNVQAKLRIVAAASVLSLSLLALPAEFAHAKASHPDRKSCEKDGYFWNDTLKACADRWCPVQNSANKLVYVAPGTTGTYPDGKPWYCDGFTGTITPLRTAEPVRQTPLPGSSTLAQP